MAVTIQIIVAGGLLLAWIWVLGRPLLNGAVGRSDYRILDRRYFDQSAVGSESGAGPVPGRTSRRPRLVRFVARWWRRPIEIRRRQMMMATMFASFASFLMAIALRDRYVYLFAMMATLLVVHLLVASQIGGRLNEARRSVAVTNAKRRVQTQTEPQAMLIRAPRVEATSLDRVNELVSMLAESKEAKAEPIGVTSYVSDLIDLEWGELEQTPSEGPAAARVHLEGDDARPEPEIEVEVEVEIEDDVDADAPAVEPIFTRAVKDTPSRSRRKAQPIYIESQLDEGELAKAKAVNHP